MAGARHFVEAENLVIKSTGRAFDLNTVDASPMLEVRLIAETGLVMYKEMDPYDVKQLMKYLNMWLEEAESKKV